jgi:hypothetical protein
MGIRGYSAAAVRLALMAGLLVSCQRLVGIHPSRDAAVGDQAPPGASDGATPAGAADSRPDTGVLDVTNISASDAATSTSTPDAAKTEDAKEDRAPTTDARDGAGLETGGPSRDGSLPDGTMCPGALSMTGTVYQFTAGPNTTKAGMGVCSFPNSILPTAGHFYGAVEGALLGTAERCGVCMRVQLGQRSVEVTIIDVIQPLPSAHGFTLAIDAAASSVLSAPGLNLDVQFAFVPCTDPGNIQVAFSSATDPSVLVLGHRNQLASIRIATGNASTTPLTRQVYNVWRPPGGFMGSGGVVTLELTDILGNTVILPNLAVSTSFADTGGQFPLPQCPAGAP